MICVSLSMIHRVPCMAYPPFIQAPTWARQKGYIINDIVFSLLYLIGHSPCHSSYTPMTLDRAFGPNWCNYC